MHPKLLLLLRLLLSASREEESSGSQNSNKVLTGHLGKSELIQKNKACMDTQLSPDSERDFAAFELILTFSRD